MNRFLWLVPALLLPWVCAHLDVEARDKNPGKTPKITWKKIILDRTFRSEGVGVADVNKDGKLDVIVGDCWYEAPKIEGGEWKRHILRADRKFDLGVYSDSFCCFTDDFNGDSYPDVIVIPFPGNPCYWYENPGAKGGLWQQHLLTNSACNETPIYVDLFKTGKKLLVMGWNPQKDEKDIKKGNYDDRGELCYFVPGKDPTQPWTRVSISGPSSKGKTIPGTARFAHGLGHGDVNGDGRVDIIVPQGWWEQPEKTDGTPWKFHPANIAGACADMHVMDIDGDGKADIISSSAHNYGFWWSQQKDANTFVQRTFFPDPFAVAKLPKDHGLSEDELKLYNAVNKIRADQGMAPWKLNSTLTARAREVTKTAIKDKVAVEGTSTVETTLTGGISTLTRMVFTGEFKPTDIAAGLYPDAKLKAKYSAPHLEIGVSVAKTNSGQMVSTLKIGDQGQFSLPSQTHALQMVDIDGDGLKDLVTGRRWWAHGPRGDAGPNDPAYLYWFQAKRDKEGMISFTPHVIDDDSGIGTSFAIADMNGDGLPDVIVANKKGVHVFLQQR